MVDYESDDPEYWAWVESEKRNANVGFHRTAYRVAKRKRLLDCGHWIDGGEPYRYQVWKDGPGSKHSVVEQRTDCEFCARKDNRY